MNSMNLTSLAQSMLYEHFTSDSYIVAMVAKQDARYAVVAICPPGSPGPGPSAARTVSLARAQ